MAGQQPMSPGARRALFPRGMRQPEGGYRFSLDSLLLASFAQVGKGGKGRQEGLDLGCGCGVIGTALLLANPEADLHITGLDVQPEMVECARANGAAMGFDEQLVYENIDISSYDSMGNSLDFVMANPPYRELGRGRVSPGAGRAVARFEGEAGLDAFCRAACRVLRDKAPLYLVHLPERLPEAMEALASNGLTPKRARFVHSRLGEPARIMLLEGRKNGGQGLTVEPPLVLYEGAGERTRMTEAALAFCPFLQCNGGAEERKRD